MVTEAEAIGLVGSFEVIPPPGLTATGRIRQFQTSTVEKLAQAAIRVRDELANSLQIVLASTYTEGEGTLQQTTKVSPIRATRDGVSFDVTTGAPHIVFLTGRAGQPFPSPGHEIVARSAPRLRFFWKSPPSGVGPPGVYSFDRVFWRPRRVSPGEDPIDSLLSYYTGQFTEVMLATHETAVVEFVDSLGEPTVTGQGRPIRPAGRVG